jgi:hypothetical protein
LANNSKLCRRKKVKFNAAVVEELINDRKYELAFISYRCKLDVVKYLREN